MFSKFAESIRLLFLFVLTVLTNANVSILLLLKHKDRIEEDAVLNDFRSAAALRGLS
jgi:hypothetical protein